MMISSVVDLLTLALHALQDVAKSQLASLKGCIALLRALPPHGGNLYSVLLAGVFEETGFRSERTGILFTAMQSDDRLAPADWDIRPWRQLLSIYGRCAQKHRSMFASLSATLPKQGAYLWRQLNRESQPSAERSSSACTP